MKAIIIAEEAPTRLIELPEGESQLKALQDFVGGFIEALPVAWKGEARDDATSYINESGKFERVPNIRASRFMHPIIGNDTIHGPLVVCGFDASKGENRPIPDDLEAHLLREFS